MSYDHYGRWPSPQPPKRHWGDVLLAAWDVLLVGLGTLLKVAGIVVAAIVVLFLLRWGYTEYYISTHCTLVLGTRVCQ